MNLRLLSNSNPTISQPRKGHLSLASDKPFVKRSGFKITTFAFQVFSPDPAIPVIQKIGSWKDFINQMETVSYQSKNRDQVFDEQQNAIILACAKVAPILENEELGPMQRMSLILPAGKETPIAIVYDHVHYYNRHLGQFLFGKDLR